MIITALLEHGANAQQRLLERHVGRRVRMILVQDVEHGARECATGLALGVGQLKGCNVGNYTTKITWNADTVRGGLQIFGLCHNKKYSQQRLGIRFLVVTSALTDEFK